MNTIADTQSELDLFSVACRDYYKDSNKVVVRFIHQSNIPLYVNETVLITNSIERNDNLNGTYTVNESEGFEIVECNNLFKTFSIICDKFQSLKLNGINIVVDNGIMYLHFTFDEWHYFRSWETHGIKFSILFSNSSSIEFENCEYVSDTELRWRYDANLDNINDFMCYAYGNDTYTCVGYADEDDETLEQYTIVENIPETACFTDELYIRKLIEFQKYPRCVKWELYKKECNDGTIFGMSARRINYKFQDVNMVSAFVTIPIASIPIPIVSNNGYDTYQETNINEKFVKYEVERSKNKIVELEKYVYHPVYRVVNDDIVSYIPLMKIKFNFHFRQRLEDGWIVDTNGLWNGMGENSMLGDVTQSNVCKFFSYTPQNPGYGNDRGRQSDLLCYLGFSDTDVKFQKSRLKKSFIRLSFYDSPNQVNQNLLSYSIIFLDSGLLFSKMMRGANKNGLYYISGSDSELRYDNAKVNTEPCFPNHDEISVEDIENFRLSSQIVVSDRCLNENTSGFYLYLWADNDNVGIPSDVYMRVDFNHAGYGRVIPMTMPFIDDANTNHILTMEEIYDKWKNHGGWGVRLNEKYSYIHFKYVYDSDTKRHVYYLDTDTYGENYFSVDGTPDELELNLYEPKITF